MISIEGVIQLHEKLINKFGGAAGIRDMEALKSSLLRPYQTFNGSELYPTTLHKASALVESILINHPFIDGNKRLGYFLMRLILLQNKLDIKASEDDKYFFILGIAKGDIKFEEIYHWLEVQVTKVNSA